MPVERAPRAAKKKATEALHELVRNDEELVRFIQHGDSLSTQDHEQSSQSQPKRRANGINGDGDGDGDGDGSERAASDSDEGDNWKPMAKKRRKTPEFDDNHRKKSRSVKRQSRDSSGDDDHRRSVKQLSSKGDRKERSKGVITKRSIAPDEDEPTSNAGVIEQKAKRKRKKKKMQRIPTGEDAEALDSDRDILDSDHSESEDSDDDLDDEDEEVDGLSRPGIVKSESEDENVGGEQPMWTKATDSFGYRFGDKAKRLTSMVHTLMSQEQKALSTLSLMALDPRKKDENYRWPVREGFLPSIPESSSQFMHVPRQVHEYDEYAARFVKELTGVPKTAKDYSDTSSESSDHEMEDESEPRQERHDEELSTEYDAEAEEARRESLQREARAARKKKKHERHADERAANTRLLQVQKFFSEEMASFGQRQYRKGKEHRMDEKTRDILREKILPLYRDTAMNGKALNPDDEPDDEMPAIQERALAFSAENRTRKILDKLPWVIRQGALGAVPPYVANGVPKPITTEAEYERGWDTMMAAASMAGVEDRILKKVSLRMQNLLSHSVHPARYELPPKTRFSNDISPGSSDIVHSPTPHYLTGEFIDPLDPKFRLDALVKNKYKLMHESLSTRLGLRSKGQEDRAKRKQKKSESKPLQKVE